MPGTLPAEGRDGTEGNGMPISGSRVAKSVPAMGVSGIEGTAGGCTRKNSLAIRVSVATSGSSWLGSLVLMVLTDFYVLEHTEGVFGQHGRGAIQRDQVGGHGVAVNPHEADGKAWGLLAG